MTELIVYDLDGTLIGSSGAVRPTLWAELDRLSEAGLPQIVCTGRPGSGVARRVASRLGPGPHIFHNGGLIAQVHGDALEIVHAEVLPQACLRRLVETARELELTLELYTARETYVDRMTPECARHAEVIAIDTQARDLDEVIASGEPVLKAQWIVAHEHLERILALKLDGCQDNHATSTALPGVDFVSVTRQGVDKGVALDWVASAQGWDLTQAIAIGDSVSDLPILERVGQPWVMSDAPAAMRERYDSLASVDDDGVLDLLRPLLRA